MPHDIYSFIVIERDVFVARDMRDCLQAACVGCDVIHLRYPAELTGILEDADDDHRLVIVTKMGLEEIDASGLADWAKDHSAEIVIRAGDDPVSEVLKRGWRSLTSPFTRDDILALVESLALFPRLA